MLEINDQEQEAGREILVKTDFFKGQRSGKHI